jgi:hypothetical protein
MIIAQISDPHITHVGGKADRQYQTATHLQCAVAHLISFQPPGSRPRDRGLCRWRQQS